MLSKYYFYHINDLLKYKNIEFSGEMETCVARLQGKRYHSQVAQIMQERF